MIYCHAKGRGLARGGRRSLSHLWCALLALFVLAQSFIVQTHFHEAVEVTARTQSAIVAPIQKERDDDSRYAAQDSCAICRETGQSGPYLLPPPIMFSAVKAKELWSRWLPIGEFRLPTPPVGWLGRAPPQ